jgi:GGDEF domain-containing protein
MLASRFSSALARKFDMFVSPVFVGPVSVPFALIPTAPARQAQAVQAQFAPSPRLIALDSAHRGLSAFGHARTAGQLRTVVNSIRALPGMRLTILPHPEALLVAAREQRELARLYDLDLETGLANRRRWNREVREAKSLADSSFLEIAVLVLQLPEASGARVLARVAHRCLATLRPEDLVARLGHRQLGCLLRDVTSGGAVLVSARLREVLAASELCAEGTVLTLHMIARESVLNAASLCA